MRIANGFDEADDDLRIFVLDKIPDVIGSTQAQFIASRNRITGLNAARGEPAIDSSDDAAALAEDCDRTTFQFCNAFVCQRLE